MSNHEYFILPDGTIRTNDLETAIMLSKRLHQMGIDRIYAGDFPGLPSSAKKRDFTHRRGGGFRHQLLQLLLFVRDSDRAYSTELADHIGLRSFHALSSFGKRAPALFAKADPPIDWADVIEVKRDQNGSLWCQGPDISRAVAWLMEEGGQQ